MFNSFRQKFRNWAFRRTVETGTVVLNQRRVYIIPTRQGFGFAIVLLLMLLGDINYNLSLGYVLTFLLATAGGMSMLHTFRNMAQLEIHAGQVAPVFAGEQARFVFHFNNPGAQLRYQLHLHDDANHRRRLDHHDTVDRRGVSTVAAGGSKDLDVHDGGRIQGARGRASSCIWSQESGRPDIDATCERRDQTGDVD